MAKSKGGGSRSRLRGKLANDVYSIGKDGKGNKQQVVRSLAETVRNPQTQAQMRQRMILSTVSMLSKGLHDFVDHSFDGVPVGQPSVSEFVRRAIKTYNEDAAKASPSFGYLNFGSKNFATSAVQVSDGKALIGFRWNDGAMNTYNAGWHHGGIELCDTKFVGVQEEDREYYIDNYTVGDFVKNILGGSVDNYLTYVVIGREGQNGDGAPIMRYMRIHVKDGIDLDRVMEGGTAVTSLFDIETNFVSVTGEFQWGLYVRLGDKPYFTFYASQQDKIFIPCGSACILSKKTSKGWQHSKSFMQTSYYNDSLNAADYPVAGKTENYPLVDGEFADALSTYPVGEEKFLNGGEL